MKLKMHFPTKPGTAPHIIAQKLGSVVTVDGISEERMIYEISLCIKTETISRIMIKSKRSHDTVKRGYAKREFKGMLKRGRIKKIGDDKYTIIETVYVETDRS